MNTTPRLRSERLRPRRRGRQAPAALLISLVLALPLAAALLTRSMPAQRAEAAQSQSPSSRFSITLDKLEPKVVQPGDTVQLAGTLKNTSGTELTGVSVELRVSLQRIGTRYDLARESDPSVQTGFLVSSTRQRIGTVEPDDVVSWSMSVPVKSLGLPSSPSLFGAYPLTIEATSTGGSGTERTRLPTTLMWMPKGAQFTPTKVSWLWPLIDGVHRGIGDTFLNDDLAKDLSPSGRIGGLTKIAAESKLPLSYVVDPALVDDASAMAAATGTATTGATPGASAAPSNPSTTPKPSAAAGTSGPTTKTPKASPPASSVPTPYRVAAGDATKPGTGAAVAAGWLDQLRTLVTTPGSALIDVPYGDPDLVALDRAGLLKEIAIARSTGGSTLLSDLAPPTLPNVVWPVDNALDEPTLDDLASDRITTVILSDDTLQPRDPNAVASPRTNLQMASGSVNIVLTDSTIDALIAHPNEVAGGPRAAEQRFLAETMLITEQRPGEGSSVVLVPPRHADPSNPYLKAMLVDSGAAPWLHMVNLAVIADQRSDDVPRQPLGYPRSARAAELPQSLLGRIAGLRDDLSRFNAVLDAGTSEPFLSAANLAIVRAESSSWRSDPAKSVQIMNTVAANLQALTGKVVISNPKLITLTSRKQRIPITVVNNLPEPITVQIQLTAANPARLKVSPIPPFTIDGKGGRHDVLMEVEATTNGRFDVEAQLMTPETTPRTFGAQVSFEVNSTAYGAVALAIAGSAAGLLFLLSGIRIFRRVRRVRADRQAATPHGGSTASGPAGTDLAADDVPASSDTPSIP